MNIHPKAKERILVLLQESLSELRFENGNIKVEGDFKKLGKLVEAIKKANKDNFQSWEVIGLWFDHLIDNLGGEKSGKIASIFSKEKLEIVRSSFVDLIESYPRNYYVYAPIDTTYNLENNISITSEISIVTIKDDDKIFSKIDPDKSPAKKLAEAFNPIPVKPGSVCFKLKLSGFSYESLENLLISKSLTLIKQLFYLGYLWNIFSYDEYKNTHLQNNRYEIVFIEIDSDEAKPKRLNVPSTLAGFIKAITTNESKLKEISHQIEFAKSILSHFFIDKDTQYLRLAVEWACESLSHKPHLISFIQQSIAFEVVLGKNLSREAGLKEQLADRCSYILGTKVSTREKIKEKFRELYQLRSDIVHGDKSILSDSEKGMIYWGRETLDRVLRKEIRNLI